MGVPLGVSQHLAHLGLSLTRMSLIWAVRPSRHSHRTKNLSFPFAPFADLAPFARGFFLTNLSCADQAPGLQAALAVGFADADEALRAVDARQARNAVVKAGQPLAGQEAGC